MQQQRPLEEEEEVEEEEEGQEEGEKGWTELWAVWELAQSLPLLCPCPG